MVAALQPAQLLEARERGGCLHPVDQALLALRLSEPDDRSDPAQLALSERDRRLIALRQATFGDAMPCILECGRCGASLEFAMTASGLLAGVGVARPPETLTQDGWEIALRPLDSRDLAAAALSGSHERAAAVLVRRAATVVRQPAGGGEIPGAVLDMVAALIGEREAAAEVALDVSCAACGASWVTGFDIGAYLWTEIDAAAVRLIGEVAALARWFGWSESEILALSPARRRSYLDALGAT